MAMTPITNRGAAFEESPSAPSNMGKNYLLLIGIDQYQYFNKLFNAVKDINDFESVLLNRYEFLSENTIKLLNEEATRENILLELHYLAKKITPQDNFIFYFAGHGVYDEVFEEGYWIPYEGHPGSIVNYIPNNQIKAILSAIKSHHSFLIVDSCFAGSFFLPKGTRSVYSRRHEAFPSRWGLTSGRSQPVSDGAPNTNSPFAEAILEKLRRSPDALNVQELCAHVTAWVEANTNQAPIGEPMNIEGHQSGQFVFRPKIDEEAIWEQVEKEGKADSIKFYLAKFPEGKYVGQALQKLRAIDNSVAPAFAKRGEVLYHIPHLMALNEETKCTVRLAVNTELLLAGFGKTEEAVIQQVRISDSMGVELIDPEEGVFNIRSYHSTRQSVYDDEHTEWVFRVKPLREGIYPLVLKVSTIDASADGKEKLKEYVLEEEVKIITSAPAPSELEYDFKSTSYSYIYISREESSGQAMGVLAGERKERKRKRGAYTYSRQFIMGISIVLLTAMGVLALNSFQEYLSWKEAMDEHSRKKYEEYLKKFEDGRYADEAEEELLWMDATEKDTPHSYEDYLEDSDLKKYQKHAIDALDWYRAFTVCTITSLEGYLKNHPDGRYKERAKMELEKLRSLLPDSVHSEIQESTGKRSNTAPLQRSQREKNLNIKEETPTNIKNVEKGDERSASPSPSTMETGRPRLDNEVRLFNIINILPQIGGELPTPPRELPDIILNAFSNEEELKADKIDNFIISADKKSFLIVFKDGRLMRHDLENLTLVSPEFQGDLKNVQFISEDKGFVAVKKIMLDEEHGKGFREAVEFFDKVGGKVKTIEFSNVVDSLDFSKKGEWIAAFNVYRKEGPKATYNIEPGESPSEVVESQYKSDKKYKIDFNENTRIVSVYEIDSSSVDLFNSKGHFIARVVSSQFYKFSEDGSHLAYLDSNSTLNVVNNENELFSQKLNGQKNISSLYFSPDNQLVYFKKQSSQPNGKKKKRKKNTPSVNAIWSFQEEAFNTQMNKQFKVYYNYPNERIFTASRQENSKKSSLLVVRALNGEMIKKMKLPGQLRSITHFPGSQVSIIGYRINKKPIQYHFYDAEANRSKRINNRHIESRLYYNPDSTIMISTHRKVRRKKYLPGRLWTDDGVLIRKMNKDYGVKSVEFSQDGTKFMATTIAAGGLTRIWGIDGAYYGEFAQERGIRKIDISKDGKLLLTNTDSKKKGRQLWGLRGDQYISLCEFRDNFPARFSPNEDAIYGALEDTLRFFNTRGALYLSLPGQSLKGFTKDGSYFFTEEEEGGTNFWSLTGELVGKFDPKSQVIVSEDSSRFLVLEDGHLELWSENGRIVAFEGVKEGGFLNSKNIVYLCFEDGRLMVVDSAGMVQVETYADGMPQGFIFTPDGKKLIIYTEKGEVSVWNVETGILGLDLGFWKNPTLDIMGGGSHLLIFDEEMRYELIPLE